ncbi:RHS repeat-associated core domain-containing protein [Pseudomonas viridiflava]|uniref:RHS repeat-associated core domain-containing protein n=1 Tax=Pseudomonas viridiflava TaxID=33069 RepID=UPI000F039517|nr:RHS repeat-associated core domain-containing protein [Pseudomonas viridiflava]
MAHKTTFCLYRYDPLDRLATRTPLAEAISKVFYKAGLIVTETQGGAQRSFFQHNRQLLACRTVVGKSSSVSLTTNDLQNSVLSAVKVDQTDAFVYTPYGHYQPAHHLPGFNGERPDPITGHYLLGNGYRAYNPVLMRFNGTDDLSPFGKGGLNAYAYCAGDPVNRSDPSGHVNMVSALKGGWSRLTRKVPEVPGLKSNVELLSLPRRLSLEPQVTLTDMPVEVFARIQRYLSVKDISKISKVPELNALVSEASDVNFLKYMRSKTVVRTAKGIRFETELEKIQMAHLSAAPGTLHSEARRVISETAAAELARQNMLHKRAEHLARAVRSGSRDSITTVSSSGSQDVWLERWAYNSDFSE